MVATEQDFLGANGADGTPEARYKLSLVVVSQSLPPG
jgi:hypothetical protein